ncbi:uncharacterized protein LOC128195839 [Vigna angularis]|uniref:uncharacterized protein LOC128195839 n=1 Tax=Phaseolus angularis TaxID=3914 RepID=UPI0022B2F93D|nr:uncharacterized protein LOC128195839 [Vigna angularis]
MALQIRPDRSSAARDMGLAVGNFIIFKKKRRRPIIELAKMRLHVYDSSKNYKEKVKFYHGKKLVKRVFNPGQWVLDNVVDSSTVLAFNSRLKVFPGKLKSKWSGLFMTKNVLPHGVVVLKDPASKDSQRSWVVNGQRLKHYLGGEVERLSTIKELVDPD